jgi:hypothetical protein
VEANWKSGGKGQEKMLFQSTPILEYGSPSINRMVHHQCIKQGCDDV